MIRKRPSLRLLTIALSSAALAVGCASNSRYALEEEAPPETLVVGNTVLQLDEALSAEAVAQRKFELRRAARDLQQFGATAQSMRLHGDWALQDIGEIAERYLMLRVDPLLQAAGSSEDSELSLLDAELRLIKADLLIETLSYHADDAIDDVERRYGSHTSMVVRFPVGQQSTVDEGIQYLRARAKGAPAEWFEHRASALHSQAEAQQNRAGTGDLK